MRICCQTTGSIRDMPSDLRRIKKQQGSAGFSFFALYIFAVNSHEL